MKEKRIKLVARNIGGKVIKSGEVVIMNDTLQLPTGTTLQIKNEPYSSSYYFRMRKTFISIKGGREELIKWLTEINDPKSPFHPSHVLTYLDQ